MWLMARVGCGSGTGCDVTGSADGRTAGLLWSVASSDRIRVA